MRRRRPPSLQERWSTRIAAGVRVCRNPHKWVASWLLSCFSLSRLFLSGCLPAFLYLALLFITVGGCVCVTLPPAFYDTLKLWASRLLNISLPRSSLF